MTAILRAEGRYTETEIDDEIVVMSLDSGDFFSLTGTARAIWLLIDGNRDRDRLLTELAQDYEIQPAEAAVDLDPFLEQLEGAGLIVRR